MPSLWNQVSTGWFAPGMIRDTVRTVAAGRFPRSRPHRPHRRRRSSALLLFVRVLSMIWSALRLYEFRLSRVGEDLRTEYGLLTRVTATIPLRRVQTLTIREAPLQRLVERMSVRVETAGGHAAPGRPVQAAARMAGPDHPSCRRARARARGASRHRTGRVRVAAAAPASVSPRGEADDDSRSHARAPVRLLVRLGRARRAAVHASPG